MALIPLGFWAASGAGGGAASAAYELISTTVLGSSQASVTFSGLGTSAAAYKHLQIRATEYYDAGGFSTTLRFNADTGSNYAYHGLYGNGSSVASGASTSASYMLSNTISVGHTADTNDRVVGIVDILDFASTSKNKTIRAFNGRAGVSSRFVELLSGVWLSTSAVTSITLGVNGSPLFNTGSRFSLYGLK
jgi:hypothetical protein